MDKNIVNTFLECLNIDLIDIVISNTTDKEKISKVKIRPIILKNELYFQISEYVGKQIFHSNETIEGVIGRLPDWFEGLLKQIQIRTKLRDVSILVSKKGKATIKSKQVKQEVQREPVSLEHNRKKAYILKEGMQVPFLVDLGVMSSEGKIIQAKYDKFKQINRYLEFIEDVIPSLDKSRRINIIDFGCGKSYLTFAMYYYLHDMKGLDVYITGLDLKEDVIHNCNQLSKQYGYENLRFLKGDIASFDEFDEVDMVVTLHACDTATDYALFKAVNWGAKVILSVPCCQHEVNKQMKSEALDSVLKYGLIKERMAALVTDGLRASLLEEQGYRVQILEFIDIEHTPKNILIRAIKKSNSAMLDSEPVDKDGLKKYKECIDFLNIEPTLYKLFDKNRQ